MLRPSATRLLLLCSVLLTAFAITPAAAQKAPTFTTIDFPGATQTEVNGINMFGTIVGTFVDSGGLTHGFLQMAGGTFQTLDAPAASFTVAFGINSSSTIVGWYSDSAGVNHGYMDINGVFTTIDPPGSTDTNTYGVDDANAIVGTFFGRQKFHGFKLTAFGHFDTLDAPNGARFTAIIGINNTLPPSEAGSYLDSAGLEHGFINRRFNFTDVTVAGVGVIVTSINGINDKGESVGFSGTSFAGPFTGFRRTASGKFHRVLFPSATDTRCRGVNDAGVIVGRYTDSAGVIHGFQMTP